MDNSFTVRVDKVFGSLDPTPNSSLRSLWSLTGEEVEKREWNRDRGSPDRENDPCSSTFDGFFSKQRKTAEKKLRTKSNDFERDIDLDDDSDDEEDDEDEQQGTGLKHEDNVQEEWEVRSSVGLDCTLDREEEEDVHDKFATGKEDAGDRLYMKDITDYGPYLNSHNILPELYDEHEVPDSFDELEDYDWDPRASHMTAKARLIEDEGGDPKSILKRKEKVDKKSGKRVRFDPACKDTCEDELESAQDSVMVNSVEAITSKDDTSCLPRDTPSVPDYIQNPSKYTRYTFDSTTEVDEGANQQAYMDFLNMVKSSKSVDSQQEESSADLPKSVRFVPKKKASGDAITVKDINSMKQSNDETSKEFIHRVGVAAGIAAAEVQDTEASAMEEDEPETTTQNTSGSSIKKPRQYRSMAQTEEDGS